MLFFWQAGYQALALLSWAQLLYASNRFIGKKSFFVVGDECLKNWSVQRLSQGKSACWANSCFEWGWIVIG